MSERAHHRLVSRRLQARFLTIPQAPLCYWLRERFFELLAGRTLGEVAHVPSGISTGENQRFLRYEWECPARESRWSPYSKGGGHAR